MSDESPDYPPKLQTESDRDGSNQPPRKTALGYSGSGGGSGGHSSSGSFGMPDEFFHELNRHLKAISALPYVQGSMALHFDGELICQDLPNLPRQFDLHALSWNALQIYMSTEHMVKKFRHGDLHQLALKTETGFVYIANFSSGLLVTLLNTQELPPLLEVFKTIRRLIVEPQ